MSDNERFGPGAYLTPEEAKVRRAEVAAGLFGIGRHRLFREVHQMHGELPSR